MERDNSSQVNGCETLKTYQIIKSNFWGNCGDEKEQENDVKLFLQLFISYFMMKVIYKAFKSKQVCNHQFSKSRRCRGEG